ncbi:hypothetical protein LEM8419_02752 [Neolewinella maritima]|uniref:HTH LytTR-type domain-containing protein n=1 Tax=Neolewinella maritima TaxID=1383882 RepID=A0ABM9B3X5_9BACT|nr:LytTR family DNA-binding domain-containing protein [Neolewinella maritima]CAH1001844.1 hypothetical protein LEM8419_02752 [Neolewinella maritima]
MHYHTHSPAAASAAAATLPLTRPLDDRIFINQRNRMIRVLLRDIQYIEAQRAYCLIVTEHRTYTLSISLGKLAEQLPPQRLIRIHRSYLVNPAAVSEISDGCVVVGDRCLPVSKANRSLMRAQIRLIS